MWLMFIYSCTHVAIEDQKYDGPERSQFRFDFQQFSFDFSGAPNENVVQNHLDIALLNVF